MIKYLYKLFGQTGERCEGACEMTNHCKSRNATRYHQRTQFHNEEQNWVTLCPECRKHNDAYWDEMWADYYSDCM